MSRSRSPLIASAAALVAAGAIVAGVSGQGVDDADGARPFTLSKAQYSKVEKVATQALKRANAANKKIAALPAGAAASAAVPGPKGDPGAPGAPGGFDPSKVTRVTDGSGAVLADDTYLFRQVDCPEGSIAIGGGYASGAGNQKLVHVSSSYPSPSLASWNFRFAYSGAAGTQITITPYAVCAGA
ncbi:MAG: hypothetical protein AB7V62_02015 [Thermoleophilia bacterium]